VEVFEWVAGSRERAHTNLVAIRLLQRYAAACDYVPLARLSESSTQFASFTSLEL
jgi:hypothetical protein